MKQREREKERETKREREKQKEKEKSGVRQQVIDIRKGNDLQGHLVLPHFPPPGTNAGLFPAII